MTHEELMTRFYDAMMLYDPIARVDPGDGIILEMIAILKDVGVKVKDIAWSEIGWKDKSEMF